MELAFRRTDRDRNCWSNCWSSSQVRMCDDKGIGYEVERPTLVRSLRHRHRRACPQCPLATAPAADFQPFLALNAQQLLMIGREAFARQKDNPDDDNQTGDARWPDHASVTAKRRRQVA